MGALIRWSGRARRWACLALLVGAGAVPDGATSGKPALITRPLMSRNLLCRVERAYLDRRLAGREIRPGGTLFGGDAAGLRDMIRDERRSGALARRGLTARQYWVAVQEIMLIGGDDFRPETDHPAERAALLKDSAFLRPLGGEIESIFREAADSDGVALPPGRADAIAAEIDRRCGASG